MEKTLASWQKGLCWIGGVAIFLAVWQAVSRWIGEFRLPGVPTVASAVCTDLTYSPILEMQGGGSNGILHHLLYSFQRTLLGSGIGVVLGVMCGLLMAFERRTRLFLEAPIETMRMIPPLAAIPFFLMWFGPTETAQLTMVAFYCFFMMIINTVSAVANTSPIYTDYARTLGASKVRVYWTVILPAIVPELIGGIRVVIGVSWGIQIVTELMGAQQGLGQVFSMAIPMQALDLIIASILLLTLFAAATDVLFLLVARAFTRWMPKI